VTLDAPLEHIPVHVRGGSIIASQKPGNTTKTTRTNPWSILVALDSKQEAKGELYLDDGISQNPTDIAEVQVCTS
jgi:alpha-glucosidase